MRTSQFQVSSKCYRPGFTLSSVIRRTYPHCSIFQSSVDNEFISSNNQLGVLLSRNYQYHIWKYFCIIIMIINRLYSGISNKKDNNKPNEYNLHPHTWSCSSTVTVRYVTKKKMAFLRKIYFYKKYSMLKRNIRTCRSNYTLEMMVYFSTQVTEVMEITANWIFHFICHYNISTQR